MIVAQPSVVERLKITVRVPRTAPCVASLAAMIAALGAFSFMFAGAVQQSISVSILSIR